MKNRILIVFTLLLMSRLLMAADPDKLWFACQEGKKPWSAYVKKYAPDYMAYQALVRELKPAMQRGRWDVALEMAQQYSKKFGDAYYYQDLIRVLSDNQTTAHAPVMLPTTINRYQSSEYGPTLTVDEQSLYFVGKGRPDNFGREDIYVSHRCRDGHWQQAEIVPVLSHPDSNDAPESIHGRTMYLFRNGRVCISQHTRRGWTQPEVLPEHMVISGWQSDVMITADGQHLLMACNTNPDYHHKPSVNIYVCHRTRGGWSEPQDIGPIVNSEFEDRSPYMHPDGRTMYFCSAGHGTLGGLDVFVTRRIGDSWTQWTTPRNIGRIVNTPNNECWYKITNDGRHAYFSQVSGGVYNIYEQELEGDMLPERMVTVLGHLLDEQGEVVDGTIRWENLGTGKTIGQIEADPVDGMYAVTVPVGAQYGYWVNHPDYYPLSESVTITADDTARYVWRDITLVSYQQMLHDSTPVQLNNIFFRTGSAELLAESYPELDRLVDVMHRIGKPIEIMGHTDNTGTNELNMRLSRDRAEAVRNYLVQHGCRADMITATGYGSTIPVADNNTPEGRAQNRRVEMRLR